MLVLMNGIGHPTLYFTNKKNGSRTKEKQQQKKKIYFPSEKENIKFIHKCKVSPHILCCFLYNVSFWQLIQSLQHANSIFHETLCKDSWGHKIYNKKEAAEKCSQQFHSFVQLYISLVSFHTTYQVQLSVHICCTSQHYELK